MTFTRFSSTDPADLAALLNRLGDELTAEQAGLGQTAVWGQVANKPTTFPPAPHTHGWSAIADKPSTYPPSAHGHAWGEVSGKPSTFPPSAHTHAVGDVTGLGSRLDALEYSGGLREVKSLLYAGFTAVSVRLLRVGAAVAVHVTNLVATAGQTGTTSVALFPTGFRPPATATSVTTRGQGALITASGVLQIVNPSASVDSATFMFLSLEAPALTPPGTPA